MGFPPYCGCVDTPAWMHHIDVNKKYKELYKNSSSYIEQILESIRPFTLHLKKTFKYHLQNLAENAKESTTIS